MRILYQFPLSHYCEKVRWVLDFKELHYVAQNLTPGLHRAFTQLKTKQNYLPILRDYNSWIADSTKIALYLDDIYPEHRIIRPHRQLHEEILKLDQFASHLGEHVRRWCLASLFAQDEHSLDIMLGERGYLRKFEKITKPVLQKVMRVSLQLDDSIEVEQSKHTMQHMILELNQRIEQQGKFMVGGEFSFADISVCAMIAPLLQIEQTPWEKSEHSQFSTEFSDYQAILSEMAIADYVKSMYRDHRNALVDWRGI